MLCYLNFIFSILVYDSWCLPSIHLFNWPKILLTYLIWRVIYFFVCIMIVSSDFQNIEKAQCPLHLYIKNHYSLRAYWWGALVFQVLNISLIFYCLRNNIINCQKICFQMDLAYSTNHRVELKIKIYFISSQKQLRLNNTLPQNPHWYYSQPNNGVRSLVLCYVLMSQFF